MTNWISSTWYHSYNVYKQFYLGVHLCNKRGGKNIGEEDIYQFQDTDNAPDEQERAIRLEKDTLYL